MARSGQSDITVLRWGENRRTILLNEISAFLFNMLLVVSVGLDLYRNIRLHFPEESDRESAGYGWAMAFFWVGAFAFLVNHHSLSSRSIVNSLKQAYPRDSFYMRLLEVFRRWGGIPSALFHQVAIGESFRRYMVDEWGFASGSAFGISCSAATFGLVLMIPLFWLKLEEPEKRGRSFQQARLGLAVFCALVQSGMIGGFYLRAFSGIPPGLQLGDRPIDINHSKGEAVLYGYICFHVFVLVVNLTTTFSYVANNLVKFESNDEYTKKVDRIKKYTAWSTLSSLCVLGTLFYFSILAGEVDLEYAVPRASAIVLLLAFSVASIWRFTVSMFFRNNVRQTPHLRATVDAVIAARHLSAAVSPAPTTGGPLALKPGAV